MENVRCRFIHLRCLLAAGLVLSFGPALADGDAAAKTTAADPTVQQVVAANTGFGFGLLSTLTRGGNGANVFISPFSITQALTMAYGGAGGTTQAAIGTALGLDGLPPDQVGAANAQLIPTLKNPEPGVTVSVANALWASNQVTLDPAFVANSLKYCDAHAAALDFSDPASAQTINDWVSQKTQGKITNVIGPQMLQFAQIVLTDAVYFHGVWQHPFQMSDTHDAPFTLADGSTETVPLMSQTGVYPYLETDQYQAVSLGYGQGRIRLCVVLPKSGVDLGTVIGGFDGKSWPGLMAGMKPTNVQVFLPRFKTDFYAVLNAPLANMGMGVAFTPLADFSPMGLPQMELSLVLHVATLDVDEQGTTAAAATVVTGRGFGGMAAPPPPPIIRVDHPFLCAIVDNATGTVLFLGAITDPKPQVQPPGQ